jgi:hypothetical protein
LTTVLSMNVMPEPRMVAARIQRGLTADERSLSTVAMRTAAESQGTRADSMRPIIARMASRASQRSAYKTDFVAPGAQKIVNWISKGEFDNVTLTYFGPARAATFEATLRKQWLALENQLGTFQQQVDAQIEVCGIQYAGIVTCQFSRGRGNVTVIFNRDGTVNDLSMTPVARARRGARRSRSSVTPSRTDGAVIGPPALAALEDMVSACGRLVSLKRRRMVSSEASSLCLSSVACFIAANSASLSPL